MAVAVNGAEKRANPPNQTLYVGNLNVKIQKADLRRALYCLFSTYGPVLDVVALKTAAMRGQAHIVFRDIQTSQQAMRGLQDFELFGKQMRIDFAKGKSNIVSRLDGSAKPPESKSSSAPAVAGEAQQSIFNNPHAALPSKPVNAAGNLTAPTATEGSKSPQGLKRPRDDESDDEEAPMDEDSGGEAMEESDDD